MMFFTYHCNEYVIISEQVINNINDTYARIRIHFLCFLLEVLCFVYI